MHDDAVYDCRQRLDHGVELRGAETDAAPVERRITAAGDGARPLLADGDPVAVAPYARNLLEVGSAITRSILVAPKPHRHGGIGLVMTSSPRLPTTDFRSSPYASTAT